jgi:hypothetical protein
MAKNMAAILLNKTIFTFPICNPLYDRLGGGGGGEHWGGINQQLYQEYQLQYGEKLYPLIQRDWNPQLPNLELRVILFWSIHRDLIPIYRDQIELLCGMLQIQNKELSKEINFMGKSKKGLLLRSLQDNSKSQKT